jgi:hypothetical protein
MQTRREIIGVLGATIAGGSGGSSGADAGDTEAAGRAGSLATRAPTPETLVETNVLIDPDAHRSWRLDLPVESVVEFDLIVRFGPSVDVLVFRPSEYLAYTRKYRARYVNVGSFFGVQNIARVERTLPGGEYVVVVDNEPWRRGFPDVPTDDASGTDGSPPFPGGAGAGASEARIEFKISRGPAPEEESN